MSSNIALQQHFSKSLKMPSNIAMMPDIFQDFDENVAMWLDIFNDLKKCPTTQQRFFKAFKWRTIIIISTKINNYRIYFSKLWNTAIYIQQVLGRYFIWNFPCDKSIPLPPLHYSWAFIQFFYVGWIFLSNFRWILSSSMSPIAGELIHV